MPAPAARAAEEEDEELLLSALPLPGAVGFAGRKQALPRKGRLASRTGRLAASRTLTLGASLPSSLPPVEATVQAFHSSTAGEESKLLPLKGQAQV